MARELAMDDCEIRRRHKWGCSIEILAELNACHQQTIREILREGPEMSKIEWIKAKYYYDEGKNDREISKLLGCSSIAVLQWRRRENLPAQSKKLIPAEATLAGEVIQSHAELEEKRKPAIINAEFEALFDKPIIGAPLPEDWQQEIEDLRDDVDDVSHEMYLLHEKYLEVKKVVELARQPAVRPITFSDMVYYPGIYQQDDIDDLLHDWYLEIKAVEAWQGDEHLRRLREAGRIDRLQLERKILIAMLIGTGMTDIEGRLKRVIDND